MNKFILASVFAVAIFIGIIFIGGFTESYATYTDQEVSFQYPSEWNVTKATMFTALLYDLHSYDDIGVPSLRIVIYERSNDEIAGLSEYSRQTAQYSNGDKVVSEYAYSSDEETPSTEEGEMFIVQTGGRIFSVVGLAEDKQYMKRVADTLETS